MRFGTLTLENRYILAPMLNVTTAPYRRFCRKFQKIGLVSIPMLYTKNIEKNPKSIEKELYKIEDEHPISLQLIGSDPKALERTIDYLESYKLDVLDLNAGCPSKRAIKAKEGGYLMRDLVTLKKLIKAAVRHSNIPISVKIRTGYDNPVNIDEMAKMINDSGIDFLTIHARTVKSNYHEGSLDLDTVKRLKEKLTIPLVGNGDIINPISAKHFIEYTNVDALMIGRESMGNPEIFNQIHEYFTKDIRIRNENTIEKWKKNIGIYEKFIDDFLVGSNFLSYHINNYKFLELKRNSIWLTKNLKNSIRIRQKISEAKNLKSLKSVLEQITFN